MATTPANLSFKIDQVKAQKVRFTVSIDNADAFYGYFIANLDMEEEDFSQMRDKQLADLWLEIEKLNYESRTSFEPYKSTLVDVSCYRGSRTLKDTYLSRDNSYRLIVFQVNPKDFTIIGDIKGETFRSAILVDDEDQSLTQPALKMTFEPCEDGADGTCLLPGSTPEDGLETFLRIASGTAGLHFPDGLSLHLCYTPADWSAGKWKLVKGFLQ